MYRNTVVESVQNHEVWTGKSNSYLIVLSSLTASTAADNSSLGIAVVLTGASLDLPIKNETLTSLSRFSDHKYDTAPNPDCDASPKW